jgi:hypothetical protein
MTSECSDAPDFRVTVDPTATNGLRARSQVMADKPVTIRRERIGRRIGHLDDQDIATECCLGVRHGSGGLADSGRHSTTAGLNEVSEARFVRSDGISETNRWFDLVSQEHFDGYIRAVTAHYEKRFRAVRSTSVRI